MYTSAIYVSYIYDLHHSVICTQFNVCTTELYYIWRKHANLFSVKQLKPKTWRIFVEFDVILRHFYGNG